MPTVRPETRVMVKPYATTTERRHQAIVAGSAVSTRLAKFGVSKVKAALVGLCSDGTKACCWNNTMYEGSG